jgi:hypothetical protein
MRRPERTARAESDRSRVRAGEAPTPCGTAVLGGYFARLSGQLIPVAQAELERLGVSGAVARCAFVPSGLGFGAASQGAAGVVVERILADPTVIELPPAALSRL